MNFRKSIYTQFANQVNENGIEWVVLHGIEGFPERIGRDLDIYCRNQNEIPLVLDIFKECLLSSETEWIIIPNKIWGPRIVGISKEFDLAELHVISDFRSFIVSFSVDWEKVVYIDKKFPVCRLASFCKGCLMPYIVNDKNWKMKCDEIEMPDKFPYWLEKTTKNIVKYKVQNKFSKFNLFFRFIIANPIISLVNIWKWMWRKIDVFWSPCVPVFYLVNLINKDQFESSISEYLGSIFGKIICGDNMSHITIRRAQSMQQLIYLTKPRLSNMIAIEVGNHEYHKIAKKIVDEFAVHCDYRK